MGKKGRLPIVLQLLLACFCVGVFEPLFAEDLSAEYQAVYYDKDDGLAAPGINSIIQTSDGYIWIGTYSGLYRYNGFRFEKVVLDKRISSIMTMFVDSNKYLWIGTNDSGLARYDPLNRDIVFYNIESGLGANSVRTICEDSDGNIYVGTVSWMSEITTDGRMITYSDWKDINYVKAIVTSDDGLVAGVTNGGTLFFMRNGKIISRDYYDIRGGTYYTTLARNENGDYFAGTSTNILVCFDFKNDTVIRKASYQTADLKYHHKLSYDSEMKGFFFCAENGPGFISNDGVCSTFSNLNVTNSISDVLIDYQRNLWVVSSKQGIMELTKSPFVNVFKKASFSDSVVNALQFHKNDLYIGMDDGLVAVDKYTYKQKNYDFLSQFAGVRVRNILEDSQGNLWVCTYGKIGLVKIEPSGKCINFTESSKHTLGGRFRLAQELADGTILVAGNIGLSYIKNDTVVHTIGEQDGMNTPQILTVIQKSDGTILAGSDGDGIYVITDGKITGHIGMNEGLENLVVLRIVPGDNGYFYITSSAIFYDDGNEIRRLDNFPYPNNFDMHIFPDGNAWISSSAGIFVVKESDLIMDDTYSYILLDYNRGFDSSLTSNAWNALDSDNALFLCCNDGVRSVNPENYNSVDTHYAIRVHSLLADDKKIELENGTYHIPAKTKRIQIQPAILNFALTNPLIHVYLDGTDDVGLVQYQKELMPLSFTNLPFGKYKLRVQVLDSTDKSILREEVFSIEKEARLTEKLYFKAWIVLGLMAIAAAIAWIIAKIGSMTIINRQYEQIRDAKNEAERANRSKTEFIETMSYEIRTPLTTIIGMNELALRESTQKRVQEYAANTIQAGHVVMNLVTDVLDFANIEAGNVEIIERDYSLGNLICDVEALCADKAKKKNLNFDIVVDTALPDHLYGDNVRIRQILTNLITNAVIGTSDGNITLTVKQYALAGDIITLSLSVCDTGAYHRDTRVLGVSLARRMAILLHGSLHQNKKYTQGAEYIVTIPQKVYGSAPVGDYRDHKIKIDDANTFEKLDVPEGTKVLVVDDNEMNRVILAEMLKKSGIDVVQADSGIAALKYVCEQHFDLIFLDHVMDELDGVQTLDRMRSIPGNKCPSAPVVALTAYDLDGSEAFYLGKGFSDYMSKPISYDRIVSMIKKYILPRR